MDRRDGKRAPDGGGTPPRSPYAFLGLSFEIALPVLLFLLGGYWLDGRLGTTPWLMLLGALVGMGLGFYNLVRRVSPGKSNGDERDS